MGKSSLKRFGQDNEQGGSFADLFDFPTPSANSNDTVQVSVSSTSSDVEAFGAVYGTTVVAASVTTASVTLNGSCTTLSSGTISVANQAYEVKGGSAIKLASEFSVNTTMASRLVVSMYDRDNYAGKQTYSYGTLSGDNQKFAASSYSLTFNLVGGQYVTSNGVKFNDLTFTASTQEDRLQTIDVMAYNTKGTLIDTRTVDVVTRNSYVDTTPGKATGAEIASVAQSFIGQAWNYNGCWNLACAIDASAGVSLDQNTGWITGNVWNDGQMTVVYDAGKGVNKNWMSGLKVGDQVEMGWTSGGGHIATIDKVANGVAYVVDNSGAFVNNGVGTDERVVERALTDYAPYINQNTVNVYRVQDLTLPATGTAVAATSGTKTAAGSAPPDFLGSTTGSLAWSDYTGITNPVVAANLVNPDMLGKNQGMLAAHA